MNAQFEFSPLIPASWGVVLALIVAAPLTHAATLWTGPNTNWTKSVATPSDTVLSGKVVLTRGSRQVLYNTALGETAASPDAIGSVSPAGTLWAFGTFDSHTAFQTMVSMRNGSLGGRILNQPMVMWITNDDIFVSVTFTTWGSFGAGTVAYTRSTPSTPVTLFLSSQQITNGQFSFDYTANPGLRYVVENSSNLIDWLPVVTNVAASNPVHFTDGFIPNNSRYYRVGRMPNP